MPRGIIDSDTMLGLHDTEGLCLSQSECLPMSRSEGYPDRGGISTDGVPNVHFIMDAYNQALRRTVSEPHDSHAFADGTSRVSW